MTFVAVTTVASFEAVGSILVVAMLIVPGAAAHLLTDRFGRMLVVSVVIGGLSALLGHAAAISVPVWFGYSDTNTAGMMAATAGLLFGIVLLFAPRHGVLSKLADQAALRLRIAREDILGLLYRHEEATGSSGPIVVDFDRLRLATGTTPIMGRLALLDLRRRGEVLPAPGGFQVTDKGRHEARDLVRSHRLWESFLHESLGLGADHVHSPADRVEHFTAEAMREDMISSLKEPARDPHGEPIPPAESGMEN
jgi:manganese/zinc/iron transport system permease protein